MPPLVIAYRELSFPRFEDDILSGKRRLSHTVATFFHVDPADQADRKQFVVDDFETGDLLLLRPRASREPRRIIAIVTRADLVPLEVVESDCALLNVASVAEYTARWNSLHPDLVTALRPLVWRIEWSYDVDIRYRHSAPVQFAVATAADQPPQQQDSKEG